MNKYQNARLILKSWKIKIFKKEFVFYSRTKLYIDLDGKRIHVNIKNVFGGLKNNDWYHVFLIGSDKKLYGYTSKSFRRPPLDFEYKYYTRAGTILYKNNRITPFKQCGDAFYWDKPQATEGKFKIETIGFKNE